ncbi:glycosyltransferase family A protein [Aerococcus sp. HMSC10H05]|uniref:glycosyltransferase family 2 protein n=1 Tax=Aerococcus sp. HMSC10H05 TaxID=1581084 RepID=UPI0008A5AE4E|nr:glycosyltransferase family A protein [Aerococcus sp. HMSC10H05]OFU50731.1 hypothetical protein HMPREF3116_05015 [Aerococcus sp. HMSC10H05]
MIGDKMIKQKLVSVIIPTYGRPDTLLSAIQSVLENSFSEIEIIVVDDNDPDTESRKETSELMKSIEDSRVNYLQHQKNSNASAARNTGLRNAKGQYICYLDDDDEFRADKLEKQVIFLENHLEYDAVYCGWKKDGMDVYPKYSGSLTKELLLMDYTPMTSSIMFRREAIEKLKGFDESFQRHQDYELMLRFFEQYTIGFVPEILLDSGKNQGENRLYGERLDELKAFYLKTFENKIMELDQKEPGLKDDIYSKHYASNFWNHINHKNYKLGFNILLTNLKNRPTKFIRDIIAFLYKHVQKKLKIMKTNNK